MHTSLACGNWMPIGCLNHHTQLFVGDMVTVTFYDTQGELVDLSFQYEIITEEQGEPHNWPRFVAEYINTHIPLVEAGRMLSPHMIISILKSVVYIMRV